MPAPLEYKSALVVLEPSPAANTRILESALNIYAKDGWRLVTATQNQMTVRLFLERPGLSPAGQRG